MFQLPTTKHWFMALCIIDWETFALGDPRWDLSFLIGADKGLSTEEVEIVIGEYDKLAPVEIENLMWYKQCWDVGWKLRSFQKIRGRNDTE